MKKLFALAFAVLLTACQDAPGGYSPPPFAFEQNGAAPIRVNVAKINVVDHFQSSMKRPNMEYEFPVTPAAAVKSWANKRLQAVGTSGTLEVTIHDASAKEVPLPKTQGVKGLFTDDQDARYDARISVSFRAFDDGSLASRATGDVEVTRSRSINEKATIYDREKMYHQMTNDMMIDFDREATARLRQYFGAFLR